jgi:hypothetical protein
MSAFSAYDGAYEFNGDQYSWRCYATARVHELRKGDHAPFPKPPAGKKWITVRGRRQSDQTLTLLLDESITDFSQMLVQIEPRTFARSERSERTIPAALSA